MLKKCLKPEENFKFSIFRHFFTQTPLSPHKKFKLSCEWSTCFLNRCLIFNYWGIFELCMHAWSRGGRADYKNNCMMQKYHSKRHFPFMDRIFHLLQIGKSSPTWDNDQLDQFIQPIRTSACFYTSSCFISGSNGP